MDCAVAADEAGYVRDWLAHDGAQDEQAKMKYLKSATKHASHLCFTALLEAMTLNEEQLKILFVVASSNNNAVAFNQLLPFWKEMDVPVTDAGDTLLHLALKQGTLETIAALIQRGAKATVTNHAGKTAFHLALENETKDELIFLFQSVPAKDWPLTLWDIPRTKIPRMWNLFVLEQYKKQLPCKPSGYFQSVSHVTSTVASFFYNEGAKIRTLWHYYFSEPELTPLHNEMKYATGDDEESVTKVRQLLEIYSVNARNKKGETPLMLAAAKNRVDLMPLLLSHGADLDAMDEQFQTPLHHAASKDALQAYLFLLTITRKKQVKNINGYTPLLLAIKHGVARGQLISATARDHRIDTEKNNQGLSAIHLAAIVGLSPWRLQTLSLYVPVTLEGPNKVTALHLAASCGRLDVITLLIEQGANVEALDTHGNSMLEYMMCSKNDKIFHQFKYLLQLQNEARATCFFRAVASADFTTPLCDPRIFEAAQNHVGIQGTTMLHLCAVHNAHAVARLYVAQKPEQLDVADHFGNTALHYAALTNSKDVMRVLSEHKEHLPVNKLNHEHQTALFIACDNGHAEVCECLILLGADATIPDALGITPAQTALLKGHIPIAETLLQCGDHSLAPSRLAQLPDFVRTKIQEKYSRELAELQRIPVPERGLLQVLGLNQGASSSSSSQETNSRLAGPNRSFN